ncbi:hypothetical protein W02_24830 [Nitrospira sp. KM1]|nr:hypothetical protein [Nitrospira sp. KM1]BCA55343.1 hypothetical protein W02_24830 [Nitrospira sp. KM1]
MAMKIILAVMYLVLLVIDARKLAEREFRYSLDYRSGPEGPLATRH